MLYFSIFLPTFTPILPWNKKLNDIVLANMQKLLYLCRSNENIRKLEAGNQKPATGKIKNRILW